MKARAYATLLSIFFVTALVPFAFGSGESEAASDEPTTITMWVQNYNGTESPIEEISTMFTELYAEAEEAFNVDIVEEYQLGYYEYRDKLIATAAAGALPDIISVDNSWFPEMIRLGVLAPLDEFWSESDREDFFPGTLDHATGPDGKIYAMWNWTDTYLIYYRTDLFDAAGIDHLPTDRALTWDEFTAVAEKLNTGGVTGFMFPAAVWAGASTGSLGMFWGQGGLMFDDAGDFILDEPSNRQAMIDVLQWYQDLIYEHGVSTKASADWKGGAPPQAFLDGTVAMYLGGTWQVGAIAAGAPEIFENLAAALLPQEAGASPSARNGGFGLAISTDDPDKMEKAWQVLDHITKADPMAQYASVLASFPTRKSAFDSPKYRPSPVSAAALGQLDYARPTPNSPLWGTLGELLDVAINKVALNLATPEAAVDEAIQGMR